MPGVRRCNGFTIGPLVVLGLVLLVLTFTVATAASFLLNTAQTSRSSEGALFLAEGALAQAMAGLHDGLKPTATPFGRNNEVVRFAPFPDDPESSGEVSFVQVPAPAEGYSTNNQDGQQNVGWNLTPVPAGMAHLLARGVCGTSTRTVEAMVKIPQYAYVLSCAGAIVSQGPLKVRAEQSMQSLFDNTNKGTPDTTLGANVGSNTSLQAGADSLITGDVVCPDPNPPGVVLGANSNVNGVVRAGVVSLPVLNVTDYRNNAPGVPSIPAPTGNLTELASNTYVSGATTIPGDLKLDACTLYVDGDLHVTGGIYGAGAVFVHGNVLIDTGVDLNAQNLVALLSSGDVRIQNTTTATRKYFQGLVYTQGAFYAGNITIAGAFVSAPGPGSTGSASSLTLGPNTEVVYVSSAVSIAAQSGPPPTMTRMLSYSHNLDVTALTPGGNNGPNGGPMNPPTGTSNAVPVNILNQGDAISQALIQAAGQGPYQSSIGFTSFGPNPTPRENGPPAPAGFAWTGQSYTGPPPNCMIAVAAIQSDGTKFVPVNPPVVVAYDTFYFCSIPLSNFDQRQARSGGPSSSQIVADMVRAQTAYMNAANKLLQAPPQSFSTTSPAPSVPPLTLNNFLSDPTPLQIVTWRER
ncbi:MAG: hypothetical protein ACYCW6_01440 [Candidatus Xenobia bacterium]